MRRNLLILGFVVADIAVIVLSLLWFLAGYMAGGAIALLAAFAGVVAAARYWRDSPAPVPAPVREWLVWDDELDDELSPTERQMLRGPYWDPTLVFPDAVDDHAAQMIRALSGQTAVLPTLPEQHLLQPRRPGAHRQ